jgi:hypothetical protein
MPYNIRGSEYYFPSEPFLRNNKNYIPLRDTIEVLGGTVGFDNTTKTATATIASFVATVTEGDTSVDVSGTPVTITAPAVIENNEFFVPFDFFRDAFGYETTFDNGTVSITNPNE